VQRWEEEYGLPVRHVGGATGSVFAYTRELDGWLRNRSPLANGCKSTVAPVLVSRGLAGGHQVRKPHPEVNRSCAPVPEEDRGRSEALVALARKMWRVLSSGNLGAVAQTFRKAIDYDCTNAEAFAGLASALIVKSLPGDLGLHDSLASAKAALRRATELDPALPEAICMRGWLKIFEERDWDAAQQALESSRHQRSLISTVLIGTGFLRVAEGKLREASTLFEQASLQSALNSVWAELNCWGSYLAGDYPRASNLIAQGRSTAGSGLLLDSVEALVLLQTGQPISRIEKLNRGETDYQSPVLFGVLGYTYAVSDQLQKAHDLLRQLESPRFSEQNHYAIALVLLGLRRHHDAVERLSLSLRSGSMWSLGFPSDPMLEALWDCGHFYDFIRNANYPAPIDRNDPTEHYCTICAQQQESGGYRASAFALRARKIEAAG
jgi:hypothetical protein